MSKYDREKAEALKAVVKACHVCRDVQENLVSADSLTKKDRSPVTVGDFAAQAIVINELTKTFDYPFVAEEETKVLSTQPELKAKVLQCVQRVDSSIDEKRLYELLDLGQSKKPAEGEDSLFWTLDPIDGTQGFLRGDQYATCLALIKGSEVVVGVLGCPNLPLVLSQPEGEKGIVMAAAKGAGAVQYPLAHAGEAKFETKLAVSPQTEMDQARMVESFEVRGIARELNARLSEQLGMKAASVKMDSQCKYACVARGDAEFYLRLTGRKECIWDHGSGALIVAEAGGVVKDFLGEDLDFSKGQRLSANTGVLVCNKTMYERVVAVAIPECRRLQAAGTV